VIALTALLVVLGIAVLLLLGPLGLPRAWWPWAAALAVLASGVAFDLAVPALVGLPYLVAFLLWTFAPLAIFYAYVKVGEGGHPERYGLSLPRGEIGQIVALALVLDGIYLLLTLEPGLLQGFLVPGLVDPITFALIFLTTPVLVLGQEAIFRGYLLTRLSGRYPFRVGLFASAALFAFSGVNPFLLAELPATELAPIIFLNILSTFVMGIFLGLFFYKTNWNLLGPWVWRSVILGGSLLFPVVALGAASTTLFVLELIGYGAAIILVYYARQEPRYQARHYLDEPEQPRRRTLLQRTRARRQLVPFVLVVGVAVVLVAFAGPVGDVSSHSPVRVLAIATGSMVPTFERGTLVLIEAVAGPSDVHVGDIYAYTAPYLSSLGPVVHRVIAIRLNGTQLQFTFKGDANPSPDPRPVLFSQIVGQAVAWVPYLGYLILSPELTVAIVLALVIVGLYRSSPTGDHRRRARPLIPLEDGRS
jgi:signal peptidase I